MNTTLPSSIPCATKGPVFEVIEGETQNERILYLLTSRRGNWVSMPDLAVAGKCFAVHSRVAELRGQGLDIENRVVRKGRKNHSWYRLK